MTKKWIALLTAAATGLLFSAAALAAAGGPVEQAGNDLSDRASLQRGAQLFMNYCAGCHSLKYLRYSRIGDDLGLSEDEVMANLNLTGAKYGEHVVSAMPAEQAAKRFSQATPDLSLLTPVRGAERGYS